MATPDPTDVDVDPREQVVEPVSNELALAIREEREAAVQVQTYLPSPKEWEATMAIAKEIAATPFVPESYRNQPEAVVAAILTGRELGIGPMQSLRDIHMVDGRPAFAAQLMLAKMRAGGISLLEHESTEERAWIKARRSDSGEVGEFEFTIAEAEAAGLLSKKGQSWTRYRKDMLWARAVSRMARRFGSDLLGGLVYSKEELDDLDEGDYGNTGAAGYGATTQRQFDPGHDRLPNAVRGKSGEMVEQLREAQHLLASDLDWSAILEEAATASLGPKAGWTPEQGSEFMVRWANVIAKLQVLASESADYTPELGIKGGAEGDALIVAAFEFAFDVTPSLPLPKTDPTIIDGEAVEVDE